MAEHGGTDLFQHCVASFRPGPVPPSVSKNENQSCKNENHSWIWILPTWIWILPTWIWILPTWIWILPTFSRLRSGFSRLSPDFDLDSRFHLLLCSRIIFFLVYRIEAATCRSPHSNDAQRPPYLCRDCARERRASMSMWASSSPLMWGRRYRQRGGEPSMAWPEDVYCCDPRG